MAIPQLVTVRDFTTSRYAQIAENTEGQLTDILARAETAIQSRLGRRLLLQAYTESFRAKYQGFFVKHRPIVSVQQIRRRINVTYAWEIIAAPQISIDAGPGYVESIDPIRGYEIEVTYTAGYALAELPEDIKEAILMQAVLFSFQDLEIYGTGDAKAPGILYFHEDIDRILKPYKATNTVYH